MKAVLVEEPYKLRIADVPKPKITQPDHVLIKILSGGICGSDIGIYRGTNSLATYPRIIGHEYGGIVVETGDMIKHVKPGDTVVVDPVQSCGHCYACTHGRHNVCGTLEVSGVHSDGGFAEYVVSLGSNVYPIDPEKISKELICLVEPYSIGVQVNTRGRIQKNDKVLIMGTGPIGLCVMQDALARGAQVMMTDLLDTRLKRAEILGAQKTINVQKQDLEEAVMEFTKGEGMPVVIDTVCSVGSFPQATELASPAGRVVLLGLINKPSEVAQVNITKKELEVIGSRLNRYRFPEVIESMENGYFTPDGLVTHCFHFTEAQQAFDLIMEHPEEICKVTLNFN